MLDVPRDERRYFATRRALRFNQQSQLRRTSGTRRSHAPCQSNDGRCGGDNRTLYRRERLGVQVTRAMKPFRKHTGHVVPLDRANVDTDQIIPKQFLKRIERTVFGEFLFYDWRFKPDGK